MPCGVSEREWKTLAIVAKSSILLKSYKGFAWYEVEIKSGVDDFKFRLVGSNKQGRKRKGSTKATNRHVALDPINLPLRKR